MTSAQFPVLHATHCVGPGTGGDGAGEPTVLEHMRCAKGCIGTK